MFTKLLCTCNSLAIVLSAFYYNNLSSDPLTFSAQKFFVYFQWLQEIKLYMEVWGRSENPPRSGILSQPQKHLQRQFLGLYSNVDPPVTLRIHVPPSYISAIFILNAHEQFVLSLCNTSHEMLLRMLFMCFWLTLYINVYDLYKHLVVNQLVFTCYLLQNSNTWEMSLKYGIFFLMLSRKCCAYNSSLFSVLLQCTCQTDIPWRFKGITWTQF